MKHVTLISRPLAVATVCLGTTLGMPAGQAAPADLELLQSYVGDWRGTGTMTNSGQPSESVRCRLEVTRSSAEKIGFDGNCVLAGANLSMRGTMAYIEANNRYEAVLTSNTAFTGDAVGRRSGNTVTFNLTGKNDKGETANIRAGFGLLNGQINVDFTITQDDGSRIVADIPFDRQG